MYQWNFTQDEPPQLIRQFFDDHPLEDTDVDYFSRLVTETIRHCDSIDELMKTHYGSKNIGVKSCRARYYADGDLRVKLLLRDSL